MNKTFYITTTTPYVNAQPHIGFAFEIVAADVIARYHRALGEDTTFSTGTDEHGQKIYQNAIEAGKTPQAYVDENAAKFDLLKNTLNLSYDRFIRTTEKRHVSAAQEFWKLCEENGDIYKDSYSVKYCIGCEMEKTDSELVEGKCHLHPNRDIEIRDEENYFFRFSKYQDQLLQLYKSNPNFVRPPEKMKEITSFVQGGLKDFSISRIKSKMPWGVPVPGDEDHVMYVWFDALVNYISTIGWPTDTQSFQKYWPVVQIAGKDNLRQQSAMWQAMLLSAKLPTSKTILINGFISVDGQKMSKSLGNVIAPQELVDKYGVDATRYLLTKIGPVSGDIDIAWDKLDAYYTADLSNGLGNLVSRVAGMVRKYCGGQVPPVVQNFDDHPLRSDDSFYTWKDAYRDYDQSFENYQLTPALDSIWNFISTADKYIDQTKPWILAKEGKTEELNWVLYGLCDAIHQLAWQILPFLPETSRKISEAFNIEKILADNSNFKDSWTNIQPGTPVNLEEPLFPRLEDQ